MSLDLTGLGSLAELGTTIVQRIWPDANAAEQAKLTALLAELDATHKIQLAQTEVNKAEATHSSLFVAGWRPAIGWCMALILAYSYIVYPMSLFTVALMDLSFIPPKLPLDDSLWQLILGMLGLAAGRTVEKIKGAER